MSENLLQHTGWASLIQMLQNPKKYEHQHTASGKLHNLPHMTGPSQSIGMIKIFCEITFWLCVLSINETNESWL